ncbi:MAG: HAD-IIIA family hydrolase [Candidatus Gastranaerophilales bacterium]|nr:HAD-IIIA family hydrolase [Candidatus Gastranaerophilales bacterium]
MTNTDLLYRANKIKLIAFDVDGVMTDGGIIFDENGLEYKTFNAKDGQGIVMLNKSGFKTAIITARNTKTVEIRATMLGIHKICQGRKNKLETLEEIAKEFNIDFEEIAYMGDDLPDLKVLQVVGLPSCPNDAVEEVKEASLFIAPRDGGKGAVRDLCDLIYKATKR